MRLLIKCLTVFNKIMKIAISGPMGSGKTTIANLYSLSCANKGP